MEPGRHNLKHKNMILALKIAVTSKLEVYTKPRFDRIAFHFFSLNFIQHKIFFSFFISYLAAS